MTTPEQRSVLEQDIMRLIHHVGDPARPGMSLAEASTSCAVPPGPRLSAAVAGAGAVLRRAAADGATGATVSELERVAAEILTEQTLTQLIAESGQQQVSIQTRAPGHTTEATAAPLGNCTEPIQGSPIRFQCTEPGGFHHLPPFPPAATEEGAQ